MLVNQARLYHAAVGLTFVDQFLCHLNRRLTHLGNSASSLEGFFNKIVSRNNFADKTQAQSFGGVQVDVTGQDHFHGLGLANSLDETLGTTSARDNTQLDLGLAKDSLLTSIDDLMAGILVTASRLILVSVYLHHTSWPIHNHHQAISKLIGTMNSTLNKSNLQHNRWQQQ